MIMLSVVMLSATFKSFMLNVIKLNVAMLNVAAPMDRLLVIIWVFESYWHLAPGACTIKLFKAVIYGFS